MRTGAEFYSDPTRAAVQSPAVTPSAVQHSAWHSPVPYLFGGLGAMLGLIAFALLILACSHWRISGYLDGADENPSDRAGGDEKTAGSSARPTPCFSEGFVVIMAGDDKPTFLATPISNSSWAPPVGADCGEFTAKEEKDEEGSDRNQ